MPRSVIDLCAALAERGHAVTLATGGDELVPATWRREPDSTGSPGGTPTLIELRPWRPWRRLDASERARVDDALVASDVVHLHVPWDRRGAAIGHRATRLAKPYIVTAHGMLDEWTMARRAWRKRLFLALGGRRWLESAHAVHCNSSIEAEQSQRWIPRGRTVVAPLLTDLRPFAGLARKPPTERLATGRQRGSAGAASALQALFLGRLDPIKGIEDLIEAVAGLGRAGVDVALTIAGPGDALYRSELHRLVMDRGLLEKVEFLGLIEGEAKVQLLHDADVLVLPSRHENWGVALIEALAAGTPVITTDAVNIWRELMACGGGRIVASRGMSVPAADRIAMLMRGLRELSADRAELRLMGERGRAWVFDDLAPERVVAKYEAIYRRMRGERA